MKKDKKNRAYTYPNEEEELIDTSASEKYVIEKNKRQERYLNNKRHKKSRFDDEDDFYN